MSLTLFKSSAGSGKTYTLSKEYLRLSLRSTDYYKCILAVTFTNRAAEEMKERVLQFLIAISKGEHELIEEFTKELGSKREEIINSAQETLKHILHHYGYFNITTIDTFFHRLIRSFSREIGLHGNFSVELDNKKVIDVVTNELYTGIENQKDLKKWLIDFSINRLREGKSYDFKNEIKLLANQLFSEEYKKVGITELEDENLRDKIKTLQNELFKQKTFYEETLISMGKTFLEELYVAGLDVKDINYGKNGVANFFVKLTKKEFTNLIKTRVKTCLDNPESWSSKKHPQRDLIIALAEQKFVYQLNGAVDFIAENEKDYETGKEVLKHLYTLGLLNDLAQRLQTYKQEEEVIMISDLPDFLNQIINDSDTPFIYEKVGNRYQHFFIDEFQDTSTFQWENFRPLIQESMASGNENIIVGDAKQSIYRWRGGDSDLLTNRVESEIKEAQTNNTKNVNYRSTPQIVSFNNALFSQIPKLLQTFNEDYNFENIADVYANVKQEVWKNEEQGLVHIEFLQKEADEKWNSTAMRRMVKKIEHLQAEGHPLNDMAILVRTNQEAFNIVNYILDYKYNHHTDIEVISAEGMLLSKSQVVQFILNLYQYLLDPTNMVLEKTIIFQYLQTVVGVKQPKHKDFLKLSVEQLPKKFCKYCQHFLHLPIYELTEVLIRLFRLNTLVTEYAYLQAFQDAILEFGKHHPSDISKFLDWWQDEGSKRSVQLTGTLNAIEIITAHKSKGLQYPIVLIPFCNFMLDSRTHTSWYQSSERTPFSPLKNLPVKYGTSLAKTHFEPQYRQESETWYLESINILYVAFTRAEYGLFVFCESPSDSTPQKNKDQDWTSNVSLLLWKYFESESLSNWNSNKGLYQDGTLHPTPTQSEGNVVALKEYATHKWSNRLTISRSGKDYFNNDILKKEEEGIFLHQILSNIIHYEETGVVLDRYEKRMEITREDRQHYNKLLTKLWKNETIKGWFSGVGEVKTEVVVLPQDGEIKRMDRVIIQETQAIVIDFKSGHPRTEDEKQLQTYVKLLQEMGYKVEGYLLYLDSVHIRKI